MSTVDSSGAIHAADGRFAGHVAGEADAAVALAGVTQASPDLDQINAANLDMAEQIIQIQQDLDEKVAELQARQMAAALVADGGLPDGAFAEISFDEDDGDLTATIWSQGDYNLLACSDPMTGDQAVAFQQRYGDGTDVGLDVDKIRRSVLSPMERVLGAQPSQAVGTLTAARWQSSRDDLARAELTTVRDRVREQCPTARYVGVIDSDGSYELDAVTDVQGNTLPFEDPGDGEIFDALQTPGESGYGNIDGTGLAPRWSRGKYHRLYDLDNISGVAL
ncbi:hypothetical protein ATK17_1800 [Branchiibius hedensis]|uniref:Uncharacterized protein n=1 Tax=Branchiibius hedensis TaxID=672460 RepID=A0A2Y8ZX75_9MICO|nr:MULTISPECIES: hypothetical protein [Branchiibius]KYH44757.1 hypothetical protein AZH51_12080 [Branchiibius sp. NY16-3462-2]PWJ25664.1 hypothetical protein ATK17_1800 [Branchiibius hedensis]SSA34477.1 hypothetical protein SAMN04489750_1800 [Branchiibius hedensis]